MASLQLEIVTPDNLVLSKEVEYVAAPGVEGEFGVLPGHVPFLSALSIGELHYKENGTTKYVFVSGGVADVCDNKVTVLTEAAEVAEGIDAARAESAKKRAEERLASKAENVNYTRASLSLQRAVVRLNTKGRLR